MDTPSPLKPETLPLRGVHLIEASAGTGKTFNITRIYLRMLLHRQLPLDNILVMTFTRAATEELRARIAEELRNALLHWDSLVHDDDFYRALAEHMPESGAGAPALLKNALLLLDEAPILTIHGFCKRVLTQQAFDSRIPFNIEMEADTDELSLEAVRDWYRRLARQQPDDYRRLSGKWLTPEDFHREFRSIIGKPVRLDKTDPESLRKSIRQEKKRCLEHLLKHQETLFSLLVDKHKQKHKRTEEWHVLTEWLGQDGSENMPKAVSAFFHGGRFGKTNKETLRSLFEPLNALKEASKKWQDEIQRAECGHIAATGIDWIRQRFATSKQQQQLMDFDDLISRLADCLRDAPDGSLARQLRKQYPVALVDEFQDTDPQQYGILRALYVNPEAGSDTDDDTALYMIGDPKQAIYAFRGGDVFAYLQARENADRQWVMDTNWRSSSAMIAAGNRLFHGAEPASDENDTGIFGYGIRYHPVRPSPRADEIPFHDPRHASALQLVYFPGDEEHADKRGGLAQSFRRVIAAWCAAEIDRLLRGAARIGERPVLPSDIAILVRDGKEANDIQAALRDAGLASVYLSTRDRVFTSEEAHDLLLALEGILHGDNPRLFTAALASRCFGGDAGLLFRLREDDETWEHWRDILLGLRDTWQRKGFIAMAMEMLHNHYRPDPARHERGLTNLVHLFELLQQASQQQHGPEQLLAWLRERIHADNPLQDAELRLESEADLIRVITQHGAKGLEYPLVFVPFPTRYRNPVKSGSSNRFVVEYHDPDSREPRCRLAPDAEALALSRAEGHAESIRLLYVAVTRARYRCYLCAAPFAWHADSPLGLSLQLADSGRELAEALCELADAGKPDIGIIEIDASDFPLSGHQASGPETRPRATTFNGHIDQDWWLASFSALSRDLRHGGLSLPDRDQDDSPTGGVPPAAEALRFAMPRGVDTGNLLHNILEHLDFGAPDWERDLRGPLFRFGALPEGYDQDDLAAWLRECLDAPLPRGATLAQLAPRDCLREAGFYFPMESASRKRLAALLEAHRGQPVRLPGGERLKGMMQGFIDLIYHWRGRYYVADYKSSHLGGQWDDYRHDALRANVRDSYYDLQYLIYSLALHRYLRNRVPDYDPARHFGGVCYLYLRGMRADTDNGVLNVVIDPDMLNALDALFAGDNTSLEDAHA